jgi:uncharacterized membrane protein
VNGERHSSVASGASEVQTRVNNRIISFSDGVFAITITLLVLTIDVPSNLTSDEVSGFLWEALPQVVIYAASFMVIGTFWVRHHRMFDMCRAVDGRILVLNLVFLGFVSLLPFCYRSLAIYSTSMTNRLALLLLSPRSPAPPRCARSACGDTCAGIKSYCCPTYQKNASRR